MTAPDILSKLRGVKVNGNGWTAKCPAHDDERNSLSIGNGDNGRVLLHCHAGCSYEAIHTALGAVTGLTRRIVATYDYCDEQGNLLYQSVRYEPKGFIQRRPEGAGWNYKLNGVRRVPYRLPELLTADAGKVIFIVEGERDADRLASLGFIATTNAGGAGKWQADFSRFFAAREVVIIPDNDGAGASHARQIAQFLTGIAASVRLLELPNLPPKGDVSDWLDAGGTAETLQSLTETAPLNQPLKTEPALRIVRMADVQPETVRWLWYPYIALGKLTLLEGDPGIGKSTLMCSITSAVTRGRGLPGAEPFEPGNVLMLSSEDGLADTLRPRLDAVGADTSRVLALDEPLTLDMPGLIRLEAAIIEHCPKLVSIDPLFAYTGGKTDIHRANECRAISAPLSAIAERQGCAILAVRHLSKSRGSGNALNAGIGSIDFVAAARSVLLAGQDPDDPARRAIVQTKNNLAAIGEAVGYRLEAGQFYWTGGSDLTAGRILATASDEDERSSIVEAADFLRSALCDGGRDAKAIEAEARQAGINPVTLRRAKKRLDVRSHKVGMPGSHHQKWVWELRSAEGDPSRSEDDQTDGRDHLRSNSSRNGGCSNDLTEGDQALSSDHLHPTLPDVIYIPAGMSDEAYEREYERLHGSSKI